MEPEFSVVVPTRGDSAYLRLALDSCLCSQRSLEVVLGHDRRPDEPALPDVIFADPRVRAVEAASPGPAAARNRALAVARGTYVSFLDDDDLFLPQHLEHAFEVLSAHPEAEAVASDAYLFPDSSPEGNGLPPSPARLSRWRSELDTGRITLRALLLSNPILTPTVTMVRSSLGSEALFPEDFPVMEDLAAWLGPVRRGVFWYDSRPGVIVRRRQESASRNLRAMAECALRVLDLAIGSERTSPILTRAELRARRAGLWHDLAYACLIEGDRRATFRSLWRAIAHDPSRGKNYAYVVATCLPARWRERLVAVRGEWKSGAPAARTEAT